MKIKGFLLNKLYTDNYNRISGIFALNKPEKITSHDLVNQVRRKLNTKKVGHTGALDPFASGLMLILVGKATKLSNEFITLGKSYKFEVLLGASSDTQDTEGKIVKFSDVVEFSNEDIKRTINLFKGEYLQEVPIYSSVKVEGNKLRELARNAKEYNTTSKNNNTIVDFTMKDNTKKTIVLPKRKVEIRNISIKQISDRSYDELEKINIEAKDLNFKLVELTADVSKGTYIRQLATDIGKRLGNVPSMLYSLNRTCIGNISSKDITHISKISNS